MDINYKWIGWCKEDNHDKVWGVIDLGGDGRWSRKYVTFWGRRGKKLSTKISTTAEFEVEKLVRTKENKGYNQVNRAHLDDVYPEFQSDLEQTAVWALLSS